MLKYNSNTIPFQPVYTDKHALFLTFSYGFPLSEMQILNFFNWSYAPFVELVNVYKPKPGSGPSLFGKIVFKQQRIVELVMGNKATAVFIVEGRPLYCKRFVSQKSKSTATAITGLPDGGNHSDGDE